MAQPCFKDYYLSAQLRPLVCCCNPAYEARWKDIELSLLEIPTVLGYPGRSNEVHRLQNYCVSCSLKTVRSDKEKSDPQRN